MVFWRRCTLIFYDFFTTDYWDLLFLYSFYRANPHFNIKKHTVIFIMSSSQTGFYFSNSWKVNKKPPLPVNLLKIQTLHWKEKNSLLNSFKHFSFLIVSGLYFFTQFPECGLTTYKKQFYFLSVLSRHHRNNVDFQM